MPISSWKVTWNNTMIVYSLHINFAMHHIKNVVKNVHFYKAIKSCPPVILGGADVICPRRDKDELKYHRNTTIPYTLAACCKIKMSPIHLFNKVQEAFFKWLQSCVSFLILHTSHVHEYVGYFNSRITCCPWSSSKQIINIFDMPLNLLIVQGCMHTTVTVLL